MKYLVNTLFVALFFITVGCSNELVGIEDDINPITNSEIEAVEAQRGELKPINKATDTYLMNVTTIKTPLEPVVQPDSTSFGGGDDDNPTPPIGG